MCLKTENSLENGTRVLHVLLVLDIGLPVGSHELHGLLSLEAVEHVLADEGVLRLLIHLVAEHELLLFVDLPLHVVVLYLVQQCISGLKLVHLPVRELILGSGRILDRERIQVSCSVGINIWVEFVSVAASAARSVFHLDKVKGTAHWSMHVLELPLFVLLLPLGDLLLPNLSVVDLGIFFCLSPH